MRFEKLSPMKCGSMMFGLPEREFENEGEREIDRERGCVRERWSQRMHAKWERK